MPKKLDLIEYISSKQKKQMYVNQMFEMIAPRYDFFTVFFSYYCVGKSKFIERL